MAASRRVIDLANSDRGGRTGARLAWSWTEPLRECRLGSDWNDRDDRSSAPFAPPKSIQRVVEKIHPLTDRSGTWQETTTLVCKVNRTLGRWRTRAIANETLSFGRHGPLGRHR